MARTLGAAAFRHKVSVTADVTAVTLRRASPPVLEARVDDGTGWLVLRWLGRCSVTGIKPGARIRFEGTAGGQPGSLVLVNPLYELVLGRGASR